MARRAAISELERRSARDGETQAFIETPYRNDALLADLLTLCRPSTRLCCRAGICCNRGTPDPSVAPGRAATLPPNWRRWRS
jgi:16S rRNA (cytidine1402-2'-O)-methyltransferase